jgi:flagellar biosynthesis protein FlhA
VRFADVFMALVIIFIILLIILPLNSNLLDILLTINLAISLVILLITLYTRTPLDFSIFPPFILITTLYRLGLKISSARLILGQGYAGRVVETFGNFVISGNIGVGFVIFAIITVIQFLVITKGAERVAEVAARFTLDAMPGKQMAIDADLNSGIINEDIAKKRRMQIQQEADFYGAMDGASKFIKGDSIAGIIIIVINIVGGIISGISKGWPIERVFSTYTLLTVGDGLVSQIPALLISTAAGIIVTRAASESSLGIDFIKQITGQPNVLVIAGGALLCMSLFPGFPWWVLVPLATAFIFLGYRLIKSEQEENSREEETSTSREIEKIRKPENVVDLLQIDPIELEFGYGIIPLADTNQGGDLLDRVVMIRRQIALDIGMVIPVIRLRDNIQLNPNEYVIKIKGVEVAKGEILADHFLAMDSGMVDGTIDGLDTVEPAFGLPAKWIEENERDKAEAMGYTVVDAASVIATHLTEIVKKYSHELLGHQETQMILDAAKERYPSLVDEVIPKTLTLGEVQKVLANLIKENVSIRDIVTILETLADYGKATKDSDMLTEYVRQALARSITNRFMPEKKGKVFTLDPELEQDILNSIQKTEQGSYLSMDPSKIQKIYHNLTKELEKAASLGIQPIVVTAPIVRLYFKKLSEQIEPNLAVLSYNELDQSVEVQSIGVVRI